MTREEIIRSMECVLESDKRTIKNPVYEYGWLFDKIHEWKRELEQKPCEDAISREKMLKFFSQEFIPPEDIHVLGKIYVKKLPSVTPTRPKGKWIPTDEFTKTYHCSECGFYNPKHSLIKYCEKCGAKMEVSEDE